MSLGLPYGVEYWIDREEGLHYITKMPLEFYEECVAGAVHSFRMFEPWEDVFTKVTCGRPWCDRCETLKMWRFRKKIHIYLNYHKPKFLWMLTRSTVNMQHLKDGFDDLHKAIRRLSYGMKDYRDYEHNKINHYIGTYEVKHKIVEGFNVHQHLILGTDVARLDYKKLHAEWDAAVGYAAHLDVQIVNHGVGGAINYITAYISKGLWGGLSAQMAYWNRSILFGRHRIRTKQKTVPPRTVDPVRCYCCSSDWRSCNAGHILTLKGH